MLPNRLESVPAHISPDTGIVEQTLNAADRADGNILIPDLLVGEIHNVLGGNGINDALDLTGAHAATGGDDLATNVLSDGGGAVKGEEDGSLELGLRALNLSVGNVGAETGPLAEGEVDKVVDAVELVRDKVDTPETVDFPCQYLYLFSRREKKWSLKLGALTQCRCSW